MFTEYRVRLLLVVVYFSTIEVLEHIRYDMYRLQLTGTHLRGVWLPVPVVIYFQSLLPTPDHNTRPSIGFITNPNTCSYIGILSEIIVLGTFVPIGCLSVISAEVIGKVQFTYTGM